MSVLPYQKLKELCKGSPALIENPDLGCFQAASYDLRFGPEYYLYGEGNKRSPEVSFLNDTSNSLLTIPPNAAIIAESEEILNVPTDTCGFIGLRMHWVYQGILLPFQTQIAPGHQGRVFFMLYNLSSLPINIRYREPVVNIEFRYLSSPTDQPYAGAQKGVVRLAGVLRGGFESSFAENLRKMEEKYEKTVDVSEKITRFLGIIIGVIALIATIVPIWLVMSTKDLARDIEVLKKDVARVEKQLDSLVQTQRPKESSVASPRVKDKSK
jgi:deoxycytidine triphosphate deaminase